MIKRLMILTSASALALGTALAATPVDSGVYLEGNLGYGQVRQSVSDFTTKHRSGFAWNVDGGYKFNKNFGAEVGYTQYPTQKYVAKEGVLPIGVSNKTAKGDENYAIDLALKGILPLQEGFSLFAKLGGAYAHHQDKVIVTYVTPSQPTEIASKAYHKVVPYGAIGAGYAVTPNLELTVQGAGHTKNGDVPAMWLVTGGATYTI